MREPQSMTPDARAAQPAHGRKPYLAPVLTLFGHVAALTQSAACSESSDSIDCGTNSAPGNNMGRLISDRRLKQDIVRIGEHPAGFSLYLFRFKAEHQARLGTGRRFGVMADEVEQVCPEAVAVDADGYKRVSYDMIGIEPKLH